MKIVTLDSDEKILKKVRRHWFIMFKATFGAVLMAIIPFVLWQVLVYVDFVKNIPLEIKEIVLFVYIMYLVFIWISYFIIWTDYYLDIWLITNKRVIDVEQLGLFRREVISLRYDRIQDVTVITNGIIQTVLHFGKIHLQTAGERRKIILRDAPYPEEVKRAILEQANLFETRSNL